MARASLIPKVIESVLPTVYKLVIRTYDRPIRAPFSTYNNQHTNIRIGLKEDPLKYNYCTLKLNKIYLKLQSVNNNQTIVKTFYKFSLSFGDLFPKHTT